MGKERVSSRGVVRPSRNHKRYDSECRDISNAIATNRAEAWRVEERQWQDTLLDRLQGLKDDGEHHLRMLYSNYESDKNVNPNRIEGTCEWFLSHTNFLAWRESQASRVMWLSADPGCGKSVLAKYLVDRKGEVLTVRNETPILCYFFFRSGDSQRDNGSKALSAILHQLFLQRPLLYEYARYDFVHKSERFLDDFDALWNIFLKALRDPSNDEIVCVLDALDECQEISRKSLMTRLTKLYTIGDSRDKHQLIKFLITSRPTFHVVRDFKILTENLSEVRLRGEDESDQISREIDLVIRQRVKELGSDMDLSDNDMMQLQKIF